jgi:hypothetical protein
LEYFSLLYMFEQLNAPMTKEPDMSNGSEPINFVDTSNRAAVIAMTLSSGCRPHRTFCDRPSLMAAFTADVAGLVAELSRKRAGGQ